jgi:hypothetical protein
MLSLMAIHLSHQVLIQQQQQSQLQQLSSSSMHQPATSLVPVSATASINLPRGHMNQHTTAEILEDLYD